MANPPTNVPESGEATRPGSTPPDPRTGRAVLGWLRRHPIVCLLLLTPGIPEYLSGSSSLEPLLLNPVAFFLFLPLNLALYGPGVLLVREALVRWRKGWASMIALGAAYAILEEGIAVDTFFNPNAGPVHALGSYGHWIGVNWVWVTGIMMVHIVYSLGLPILLLGWALPETRGKSLLGKRGIALALTALAADVTLLEVIVFRVSSYWFGLPILLASLGFLAALVLLARALPADLLRPLATGPRGPRWLLALTGFALLPGTFLIEALHTNAEYFPAVTIAALLSFYALLLWVARVALGSAPNVRGGIAFTAGALSFLMLFGVLSEWSVPVVVVADVAAILFLRHLWRKYPDGSARSSNAAPT